jgi:hypothetical protein
MPNKGEEIVEKWQRSCVLLHDCRDCPDKAECLKLAQSVQVLKGLSLWIRKERDADAYGGITYESWGWP